MEHGKHEVQPHAGDLRALASFDREHLLIAGMRQQMRFAPAA